MPELTPPHIPLYSADGQLREWISPVRLERMQAQGLIHTVVRHPKGRIARAITFVRAGERPVRLNAYLGTKYSFLERLAHGRAWELKRLGGGGSTDYAPESVRPIFLQVVSDCLSSGG